MGYGKDIIADFKENPSEKILCIFEYVRPCYPEDEYNIVFLAKDGDEVKLYHYLNEADTPEENAKLDAVIKYFRQKGIKLKIRLLQTEEKPFHSSVLYPAEDSGKPFYVPKTPARLWKRIYLWCTFTDEFQLNKELTFTEKIRMVTIKRWQDIPVLLYGHQEGAELRDNQWELDPNW